MKVEGELPASFDEPKISEDDGLKQAVRKDVAAAQQHIALERPDLASCAATTTRDLALCRACDGATLMQVVPGRSRVRVFPDTRVGDWIGARVVDQQSGAMTDGWFEGSIGESLFIEFSV